jgi:AcrR family transcriptional regulator
MARTEYSVRRGQFIAAARNALARDGVAKTSLRAVAAEAGVPLGTLQYVFPSKEQLLRAVIEDVVNEIADVLNESASREQGLEQAIRSGMRRFWETLVTGQLGLQLMQYELTTYALREPGQEPLARWQYERYADIVQHWCREAADRAGETSAVPFPQLARTMLASIDGLILQHLCDPDEERSRADLEAMIIMILGLADVGPAETGPHTQS